MLELEVVVVVVDVGVVVVVLVGVEEAPRSATSCITQAALPLRLAVAL